MKKCFLVGFLLLFVASSHGQGWQWATGTRASNNYGRFSSVDQWGDIYVCGETFSGMMFPVDTVLSIGYTRLYLSKFDNAGNLIWIKTSTGRNKTPGFCTRGLTTDAFGNTYLLGYYDTTVTFDGHTLVNTYLGSYTDPTQQFYLFLAKFDRMGNNKWVKAIGNGPNPEWNIGNSITSDCAGNLYIIANFFKNATVGSFSFTNSDPTGNTTDMLIAKLDSSGNAVWAKQFGRDSTDYVVNIALTPTNDILLTGSFFHYRLEIGTDTLTDTSGITGWATSFIAKLDNAGNPIWAKKNGDGTYAAFIPNIIANSSSEFYASGYYSNDFVLDATTLSYGYGSYSYLAKYNASGSLLWVKIMKGRNIYSDGITLDGCGNVWLLAHFGVDTVTTNDTVDGHVVIPPVKNKYPLFLAGWTPSGAYINTVVLASGGRASWRISTVTDPANKLYVVGNNNLDTLRIAGDTLYGTSGANMFLAKYDPALVCAPYYTCVTDEFEVNVSTNELITNLFPNPANTECTITYNGILSPHAHIAIYDLTGRLMHTYPLTGSSTTISIENLPPGMYHCRIDATGTVAVSRKLVVMR